MPVRRLPRVLVSRAPVQLRQTQLPARQPSLLPQLQALLHRQVVPMQRQLLK